MPPDEPDHRRSSAWTGSAVAAGRPGQVAAGAAGGSFSISKMIGLLRRRIGTFLSIFLMVFAVALLLAAAPTPLYRASAEIMSPSGTGAGAADREIGSIRSQAMARDVATALALDRDAAFLSSSGGTGAPIDRAVDKLVAGVSVTRPTDTLSLLISFTATNPRDAARIANEYARQIARRQLADRSAIDQPAARILAEAEPPVAPITRSPWLIVAAGLVLAIALGMAGALLRERTFGGITTGDEIERRTGLHNLGTVPLLGTGAMPAEAIVDAPRSGFAEALRSLRTATRIAAGGGARIVAITSAAPGAGTSTLAACLARTIAAGGERVVLVSGNPGEPLASAAVTGETVTGDEELDEAIRKDSRSSVHILPWHIAENAARGRLVDTLRGHFAWILIDAGTDGDPATLASIADLILVAVRWRSTRAAATRALADRLGGGRAIACAVLTQVDMRRQVKYVHGDVANYYGKLAKYYS